MVRSYVVTGSSSGIGLAVAERLLSRGHKVHGVDIDHPKARGRGYKHHRCDVADAVDFAAVLDWMKGRGECVSGLVNAAGIYRREVFTDVDAELIDLLLRVNVKGTLIPSIGVSRWMVEMGQPGSIVNFTSLAASRPSQRSTIYGMTKGAVTSLTLGMATALAGSGIRVNAIAPGPVDTAMTAVARQDREYLEEMVSRVPLMRSGQAEDLTGLAEFLLSPDSSWITGAVIPVDGGLSASR